MTKLAEGVTRSKTDYGTVIHFYRGVKIWKRSSGYEYTMEYVQLETGRTATRDRYAAYQLKDVPRDIDGVLDEDNGARYFVDERGIIRLNQDYLDEIRENTIERDDAELAAIDKFIQVHLLSREYSDVQKYVARALEIQTRISSYQAKL